MGWMIRNDGKAFEAVCQVVLNDGIEPRDDVAALIWLYDHTGCILVRYTVLRLLVLTARRANPYIIPSEYYRGLSGNKQLDILKKWLSDHGCLLDVTYRELLKNDESIMSCSHLPLAYSEEISCIRKILSYQIKQEFIYAVDHRVEVKGKESKRLDIDDDSVLFDWTGIIKDFSKQLGTGYNIRIRRLGCECDPVEQVACISGQTVKKYDCLRKPEDKLRTGRSLLQILCEAPYSQDRILQRIEWIRRCGRRRKEY